MARIIDNRTSMDQTIKIFDSFYSVNMVVGANQYDVVHGYFISVCGSTAVANNFTAALFRVAQEIKVDVLELLSQLQGKKEKENNKTMHLLLLFYLFNYLHAKDRKKKKIHICISLFYLFIYIFFLFFCFFFVLLRFGPFFFFSF